MHGESGKPPTELDGELVISGGGSPYPKLRTLKTMHWDKPRIDVTFLELKRVINL